MISKETIESMPVSEQVQVKLALATLASTGILMAQKEAEFSLAASGADDESVEEIAKGVLEYRRKSTSLEELHELGTMYSKEIEQ